MQITKKSSPGLFSHLCEACDFDTSHIPKHGSGEVHAQAEYEGQKYECFAIWDYSWGIDWDYVEWEPVNKHVKLCPCCMRPIED